jgi:hypothetical protein
MLIELLSGMNVPDKQGGVSPAHAGEVVDVPERFGRQQVGTGRARLADADGVLVERQESGVVTKLKRG